MNVLPKKRYHQFVRNLTLLRNLTLPRNLTKSVRNLALKVPYASILLSRQVIWYSASLFMYGWFVGWIAYDILVWHKSITQVSPTNYVGAIMAMALIWAGTVIFNAPTRGVIERLKKRPKNLKEKVPRKRNHRLSKLSSVTAPLAQPQQLPPAQPEPQTLPEQATIPEQPQQTAPNISGCTHHFGYLHQLGKTKEIPDACLTCKELIQCL